MKRAHDDVLDYARSDRTRVSLSVLLFILGCLMTVHRLAIRASWRSSLDLSPADNGAIVRLAEERIMLGHWDWSISHDPTLQWNIGGNRSTWVSLHRFDVGWIASVNIHGAMLIAYATIVVLTLRPRLKPQLLKK